MVRRIGTAALAVVACMGFAASASATGACSAAPSARGEWPVYGHDLANTRFQPREHGIVPSTVPGLGAAWVFKTSAFGDPSAFNTTPVIAGGCAFIGSALGNVYAVDMATG